METEVRQMDRPYQAPSPLPEREEREDQEQKKFQAWLETLCPWDKEWALQMVKEGKPLEEIKYYVDF